MFICTFSWAQLFVKWNIFLSWLEQISPMRRWDSTSIGKPFENISCVLMIWWPSILTYGRKSRTLRLLWSTLSWMMSRNYCRRAPLNYSGLMKVNNLIPYARNGSLFEEFFIIPWTAYVDACSIRKISLLNRTTLIKYEYNSKNHLIQQFLANSRFILVVCMRFFGFLESYQDINWRYSLVSNEYQSLRMP